MNPSRLPDVSTLFPWHAWVRDPALRSWTAWMFVALVTVPPLTFVLFRQSPGWGFEASTFAFYFAAAWFLVLWTIVRPQYVAGGTLAKVAVVAAVVEFPLAYNLEGALNNSVDNVFLSVATVGVPEELAKMLPVVALALWLHRSDRPLPPRDVLFVGAVSGLAFGAVEAIHYVTEYMPSIMTTGGALQVVWRLLTDPIAHACWAGVAGYFVGLASYYRTPAPWLTLVGIGIGVPAILHGINDVVSDGPLWIAVTVVSALLFLAYARVGIAPRAAAPAPAPVEPDPVTAPIALGRHHATR